MLAANATSESYLRLHYARDIADSCPQSLFDEISLTGSSARGIATESSDIEINFWVETLPELGARLHWMNSIGAENIIAHSDPRPDNSYWINAVYKDIELEVGWQTFADLNNALHKLMRASTTDHKALRLAELVLSAKNLRGSGVLEKWQGRLQHYPSELSHKLIAEALTNWLNEDWYANRMAANSLKHATLVDHHDTGKITNSRESVKQQDSVFVKEDIHRVWRLIFALNQQWEINWKYAHHNLSSLERYPNNIEKRIWEIQHSDTLAIHSMLELIADTLELIRTNIGDSQALTDNLNYVKQHL